VYEIKSILSNSIILKSIYDIITILISAAFVCIQKKNMVMLKTLWLTKKQCNAYCFVICFPYSIFFFLSFEYKNLKKVGIIGI